MKTIDEDRLKHPELYGITVDIATNEISTGRVDSSKIPVSGQNGTQPAKGTQSNDGTTQTAGPKDVIKRDINVNKKGEDGQVNSGLTNSPEKKPSNK